MLPFFFLPLQTTFFQFQRRPLDGRLRRRPTACGVSPAEGRRPELPAAIIDSQTVHATGVGGAMRGCQPGCQPGRKACIGRHLATIAELAEQAVQTWSL